MPWNRLLFYYFSISFFLISGVLLIIFARPSSASLFEYPQSPAREALSDSAPTAFAPFPFEASDFQVIWQSTKKSTTSIVPELGEMRFWLAKDSIQWVRVGQLSVIPRARLIVEVEVGEGKSEFSGNLSHQGFTQPFVLQKPNVAEDPFLQSITESVTQSVTMLIRDQTGKVIPWVAPKPKIKSEVRRVMRAEIPVALISGEKNSVNLIGSKGGETLSGLFYFQFSTQRSLLPHELIAIDPSCSPYSVTPQLTELRLNSWVYIGCRQVAVKSENYRTTSLEFYIFWDTLEKNLVKLNGAAIAPLTENTWALRMRSQPGYFELSNSLEKFSLNYRTQEEFKYGFLGFGLGPYTYFYSHRPEVGVPLNVSTFVPLGTLYASYFVTDTVRVVAFDAFSIHQHYFNDLGIYMNTESFRAVDRRLKVNVMLGAHALSVKIGDTKYLKFGAPQGLEAIYQDAFMRGYNLSAGAFIYPKIEGKAYYNVWFRWGPARWFFEFNFIEWHEKIGEDLLESRSAGVSVGFPVFRFL